MKEYTSEIILIISGIVSAVTAWKLGGKQKMKATERQSLTKGADQIVDTSSKLLDRLELMLEQETQHRENCEKSLRQHEKLIADLRFEVNELKLKK